MQLRYFIYAVLFLVSSFVLNISFYFLSSDYRNFLKSIKDDKNAIIEDKKNLETKKENITNLSEISYISNEVYSGSIDKNDKKINNGFEESKEIKVEYKPTIEKIKETNIEKNFLNKFKEYNLKKLELHPRLFDLTTEYPNEYIEYYSEYLTIYFFGNTPYDNLKDIFQVLTYELPFSINEVNNFGDSSFYINLDKEFQDGQVRIVMSYKNRTFGLKMSKDVYPLVKEKLKRLK